MTWRLADSLIELRNQINMMWPARKRGSDGSIGDERHQSRSSDHNPWIRQGSLGVVTAIDVTHDPANGVNAPELCELLKLDHRVKYLIWNRRIWNHGVADSWRRYQGSNPHDKHFHISVHSSPVLFDDKAPWRIV